MLTPTVGGVSHLELEVDSLRGAFQQIAVAYPRLYVHLFTDQGEQRRHVLMLLGEENVRWLQDWSAPLPPRAELHILQAVSGG